MGTSVSFRSPETSRWRAAQAAIRATQDPVRIISEIANAAADAWLEPLSSRSVASFAGEVRNAFHDVPTLLEELSVQGTIEALSGRARNRAFEKGPVDALPVAERAFFRVLIKTMRPATSPLMDTPSDEALRSWLNNRGARPDDLLRAFFAEVFAQFVLHVASRDISQFADPRADITGVTLILQKIEKAARRVAERDAGNLDESIDLAGKDWPLLVDRVFAVAVALPEADA